MMLLLPRYKTNYWSVLFQKVKIPVEMLRVGMLKVVWLAILLLEVVVTTGLLKLTVIAVFLIYLKGRKSCWWQQAVLGGVHDVNIEVHIPSKTTFNGLHQQQK